MFIISILLLNINWRGSIPGIEYGNNAALFYLQGICGALFIISLCKPLEGHFGRIQKIISTLGGGTIVLLLFQPPFLLVAKLGYRMLFHPAHPAPYFTVAGSIAFTLCILIIMYPCILFINRFIPILNGRMKKKS